MTHWWPKLKTMARQTKVISNFDVCLGRVVKSKRVKASITRARMAELTGIPEANLKRREDGRNEITASELYRIADAVDVPAHRLIEEALEDYGGMEKLLKEHGPADASSNVTPLNVPASIDDLEMRRPRTMDTSKGAADMKDVDELDTPAPGEHPDD